MKSGTISSLVAIKRISKNFQTLQIWLKFCAIWKEKIIIDLFSFFIDWYLNIMQKAYLTKIEGMMAIFAIVTTAATYYKIMEGEVGQSITWLGGRGSEKGQKSIT